MAKNTYKGYLKSNRRTTTGLIESTTDQEALLQASRQLNVAPDLVDLIKGRLLTCPKCSYSWSFKGFRKLYATCPQCMKQVLIADSK